jgi:hypothetical protein
VKKQGFSKNLGVSMMLSLMHLDRFVTDTTRASPPLTLNIDSTLLEV